MRSILKIRGVTDRCVWVADSFEGLPPPNPEKYPSDEGDVLFTYNQLAVSLEQVRSNFERYGLLDDQVQFLKGSVILFPERRSQGLPSCALMATCMNQRWMHL
jgi:O-methyltransferase